MVIEEEEEAAEVAVEETEVAVEAEVVAEEEEAVAPEEEVVPNDHLWLSAKLSPTQLICY